MRTLSALKIFYPYHQQLVTLLFCSTVLLGCNLEPNSPIRIGINPWPGYEYLYLAQEKGFFRDAGLSVQIVEFSTLADGRRAFEQGLVDGIGCTLFEAILAAKNTSYEPKIISIVDYSQGGDAILANANIDSVEKLKGKNVGVEVGSISIYLLARALKLHGLSLADVKVMPMNPLLQEKSFTTGEIDAATVYPPVLARLRRLQNTKVIFSSADIPNEIVDILLVNKKTAEKRREELKKLLQVWQKTVEYTKANKNESFGIMAAKEQITLEEIRYSMQGIRLLPLAEQKRLLESPKFVQTMKGAMKVLKELKLLEDENFIDPQELIDSSSIDMY